MKRYFGCILKDSDELLMLNIHAGNESGNFIQTHIHEGVSAFSKYSFSYILLCISTCVFSLEDNP